MSREKTSPWLAVGVVVSLSFALSGALQLNEGKSLPVDPNFVDDPNPLARIGERNLTATDLRRAVESQMGLRREAMGVEELGDLLRSLIDEELLVQRAQALGLVDTDPSLRRALVIAMKEKVLSALPAPTAEEIEAFYGSHSEEYGRPLDEVEPRVLRDFERARRQEALDKYLADQRSKVSIERFLGSTGTEAKPESEPEP